MGNFRRALRCLSAVDSASYAARRRSDDVAEAGRPVEQLERTLGGAFTKALARQQLGLRLFGQVGDVQQVLDDQRVDQVFEHPHELGIELVELCARLLSGAAPDEGLDLRMLVRQEFCGGFWAAV